MSRSTTPKLRSERSSDTIKPNGAATWHAEDIKAALRRRHGPITHLSRAWGYGHSAITSTLTRSDYSVRLELRIAQALDLSPHVLWPKRWRPDGTPLPRPVGDPSTSAIPAPHRQKGVAA